MQKIIAGVVIIIGIIFSGIFASRRADIDTQPTSTTTPVVVTDKTIITSITPASGPIGTVIELKGTNLAGFEGDLDAWIINSKGEEAYLPGIGSVPREEHTIRVKIESKLCTTNNTYSGLPCEKFLTITPGVYKIYTNPMGRRSNDVTFTVTN